MPAPTLFAPVLLVSECLLGSFSFVFAFLQFPQLFRLGKLIPHCLFIMSIFLFAFLLLLPPLGLLCFHLTYRSTCY